MRAAINLLTDDPSNPSGAHWFWTRVIKEMANRLDSEEELHLLVSPKSRPLHQGYGPKVHYITYPWSNERRGLRTLSEHLYSPVRMPLGRIDVLNTLMTGDRRHFIACHPYQDDDAGTAARVDDPARKRAYRRLKLPQSVHLADAVIINSHSLRAEIDRYLEVDPRKLKLIYEAVDHDVFKPGDAGEARARVAGYGITKPFGLFVSSLWTYKNCDGLLRRLGPGPGPARGPAAGDRRDGADANYTAHLHRLAAELGIAHEVVFVGGVRLEETASFYRAADVLVYPSFNETFGLPILEAMACACPVVTSNVTAMPEIAGGAAIRPTRLSRHPSPAPSSRRWDRRRIAFGIWGCGEPPSSPGALP